MIVDAGLLVAVDRGESAARSYLAAARRAAAQLHTSAPVVAQVWRSGARQARLARTAASMTVHAFGPGDVGPVGELLRRAGTADVVDAHLVMLASRLGRDILTSDMDDFAALTDAVATRRPRVLRWQ